jgi:hypothetical protein
LPTRRIDARVAAVRACARSAPPVVDGRSLAPVAEFRLPIGTTPLPPRDAWLPGAFQTTDPLR